jgi:hypothetical protein
LDACQGLWISELDSLRAIVPSFARPVIGMIFRRRVTAQAHAQGLARLPIDVVLAELARRFDELLV